MDIPRHIYMTGIGGIGMSALAQMLFSQGKFVSGSDRDESPTTALLQAKGIRVDIGQREENVAAETEMLIYSDAVPSDNAERLRAREMGIPELSYFEALGEISRDMRTVAVAGTHGKTTTTGMLAKILSDAGASPTAIVGSIVRDFGYNQQNEPISVVAGPHNVRHRRESTPPNIVSPHLGSGHHFDGSNFLLGSEDLFIVEACEYRDHLLKLNPEILVITNIELDHTDYFPNLDALVATFRTAVHKVPREGAIICDPAGPNVAQVLAGASARIVDYTQYAVGSLLLPGEFNRENARAALAAGRTVLPTLSLEAGVHSLSQFRGSWRRFEYKGETASGALVYDDYAHHPTAVRKTLEAAREKFPQKKIVVAFHPHLYSRTKSFLHEFAVALARFDLAIVAPIYAAREADDPSVSNHILGYEITKAGGNALALDSFDDIRDELLKCDSDTLIITMGAGDIYKVAEQIAD